MATALTFEASGQTPDRHTMTKEIDSRHPKDALVVIEY